MVYGVPENPSSAPTKPFKMMAADLISSPKGGKYNIKFVLVVVDLYSRKLFTENMTTNSAKKCAAAMRKILEKVALEKNGDVEILVSDQGAEFIGKEFKDLLKEKNIQHNTGVAEVAQKMLWRYV